VRAFVTQVRFEIIVLVGKDHAGATLFDEQGPPVGQVGEVFLDVFLVGAPTLEKEQMDGLLRRLDPQRIAEILLQTRHFVDQAAMPVERKIGVHDKGEQGTFIGPTPICVERRES